MIDKIIAVLWKDNGQYNIPDQVLFVLLSGRIRFYRDVSYASIMRLDDMRQGNDRRIRWEQPGEVDRYLSRAGAR